MVLISVIPYVEQDVAKKLHGWIVALPVIGMALTVFGWLRLSKELDLLDTIRGTHRALQGLTYPHGKDSFRPQALAYLFCLLLLGGLNIDVVLALWLPHL